MFARILKNILTVSKRSIGFRCAFALAAVMVFGLWAMPQANAGVSVSATPTFPGSITVGQTNQPASLTVSPTVTGTEVGDNVTVTNLTLNPSCDNFTCTPGGELGVLNLHGPVTLSCTNAGAGSTTPAISLSTADPSGNFTFTPGTAWVMTTTGTPESCVVGFQYDVLKEPTNDANLLTTGKQTDQLAGGAVTASDGLPGTATGTNQLTIVPFTSSIVTTASTATLGGTASDSATVTGFGTLTGNVVFKLWGPAATPTCTNLVFTSAAIPVSGASPQTVASGASSVLTTPGTYYWTATFTDTDGNNTSSGPTACGAANESVTVVGCSPVLDKQVSCDGGAHFHAIGPSTTAAVACSGITNANDIVIRYVASEASGNANLFACTVTDSNGVITPIPAVGNVTSGGTPVTVTTTSFTCNSTTTAGEGDTATLSCACGSLTGPIVTTTDSANFACVSCGLTLDKQVSCNGGSTWVDVGSGTAAGRTGGALPGGAAACIGTTAASSGTGITASQIEARYVVTNTGGVPLSCTNKITDTNLTLANGGTTVTGGTVVSGTPLTIVSNGSPQACTNALDDFESPGGNTASLTCQCEAPTAGDNPDGNVTATDVAKFDCETPGLQVVKSCVGPNASNVDTITVNVTNPVPLDTTSPGCSVASPCVETGVGLTSCTITDAFFVNSSTCTGTSTPVSLTGTFPTTLNPGPTPVTFTATVPPPAFTSTSCDQATVTCNLSTAAGGPAGTITASNTAECAPPTVPGCLLRTPGFFATHPDITNSLLPLSSCGVKFTAAHDTAGTQGSAIEDLCSVGTDSKLPGTNSQLTQLARACMGANLDLSATKFLGGSVSGCDSIPVTLPDGSVISSGDVAMINSCCNVAASACSSGVTGNSATIQSCLDFVGAFSGLDCTGDCGFTGGIGVFANPGPADSSICQDSKNNGFRNTCTASSTPAAIPVCGTGRP